MRLVFNNPVYLWFLLSIPFFIITHLFTLKYNKSAALKFSNFEALARVTGEYRLAKPYSGLMTNRNLFMLLIRTLTLFFIILSISSPVLWYMGRTSEFDFVLAVDASSSMLADDFLPNRLDAAKKAADLFLNNIPDKVGVGVVSFAGTSFVEKEITPDRDELRGIISRLGIKNVGGTDLGGALVSSSNLLFTSNKSKVVILLTDGRSNVGISIDEAIEYLDKYGVIVHTIGVGTEEGGTFLAQELVSTLDEANLRRIAEDTEGKYFRAETEEELNNAYMEIAKIDMLNMPLNLSFLLIIVALSLLFLELVLVNTKYRIIS